MVFLAFFDIRNKNIFTFNTLNQMIAAVVRSPWTDTVERLAVFIDLIILTFFLYRLSFQRH